jgi:hypothetical protein
MQAIGRILCSKSNLFLDSLASKHPRLKETRAFNRSGCCVANKTRPCSWRTPSHLPKWRRTMMRCSCSNRPFARECHHADGCSTALFLWNCNGMIAGGFGHFQDDVQKIWTANRPPGLELAKHPRFLRMLLQACGLFCKRIISMCFL